METVVQIAAEGALPHLFLQIAVGGGDITDIQLDGPDSPDPGDFVVLDGPKELGLHVHGHLADLVQKQGAVVGGLKEALLAGSIGPGEGTAFIAKEFRLKQAGRNGGTVDFDKGLFRPGTGAVDGIGNQFLAHAGLSGDEDGGGGLSYVLNEIIYPLDSGAFPYHLRGNDAAAVRHHLHMACGPLKIVDRLHKVDKVVPQLLKGGYAPVAGHHVLDLACIVKDGHAGDESQTIRPAEHAGELHYLFPAPDYLGDGGIGKISAGLQQFGDPLAKDLLRGDTRVADIGVIHIENHLVLVGYQNIIVQLVHNVLIIHHAVGYLVDRGFNFGQLIQQSLPLGGSGGFTQPGDQYVNPVFRMEHD